MQREVSEKTAGMVFISKTISKTEFNLAWSSKFNLSICKKISDKYED